MQQEYYINRTFRETIIHDIVMEDIHNFTGCTDELYTVLISHTTSHFPWYLHSHYSGHKHSFEVYILHYYKWTHQNHM